MEEIRDKNDRLACKGDPVNGILVYEDKRQKWKVSLPVGGRMVIERKGAKTTITRTDTDHFKVDRELETA